MGVYRTRGIKPDLAIARLDRGYMEHDFDNRPRPYPYDSRVNLTVTAAAGADTFGDYLELIPVTTYDFGDAPNWLAVRYLLIESVSANDVYVLEFYTFDGGVTYEPLGAERIVRAAVLPRSWPLKVPCRCFNIDDYSLQARLKCATGGGNMTVSMIVQRHLHTDHHVGPSPGVWPTG